MSLPSRNCKSRYWSKASCAGDQRLGENVLPASLDLPACWDCGYEFTENDKGSIHRVPFIGCVLCDHCHKSALSSCNSCAKTNWVHPSIRAMDAAHAKRMREMGEACKGFYNPRTYNHPSWRKWDAAIKAGKINPGIRAAYRLVPGAPKIGKGIKGIEVISYTMADDEAAEFRAAVEEQNRRDEALRERIRAAAIEAAKAAQEAAMASCRTIGESAAAAESQLQAA